MLHDPSASNTRFDNNSAEGSQTQNKPVRTVLIISENERREFGGWANLISSWNWRSIIAPDLAKSLEIMDLTNAKPDLIILDCEEIEAQLLQLSKSYLKDLPSIIVGSYSGQIEDDQVKVLEEPLRSASLKEACLNLTENYI